SSLRFTSLRMTPQASAVVLLRAYPKTRPPKYHVILNEVKNLALGRYEMLRFAQHDIGVVSG
ncbi:MAG: hypothetical protein ACE5O2_17260, partial [Armatimonadota bacterium]